MSISLEFYLTQYLSGRRIISHHFIVCILAVLQILLLFFFYFIAEGIITTFFVVDSLLKKLKNDYHLVHVLLLFVRISSSSIPTCMSFFDLLLLFYLLVYGLVLSFLTSFPHLKITFAHFAKPDFMFISLINP